MGLRQAITLDTASLEPDEADELLRMVDQANFFNLPDRLTSPSQGVDQFQYRLKIERSEAIHTVFLSDSNAPEELQPLLQRLNFLVRTRR